MSGLLYPLPFQEVQGSWARLTGKHDLEGTKLAICGPLRVMRHP